MVKVSRISSTYSHIILVQDPTIFLTTIVFNVFQCKNGLGTLGVKQKNSSKNMHVNDILIYETCL